MLAFVNGTNFEALNVPLAAGSNALIALVEDLTGVTNTASISLTALTNSDGSLNEPVLLQATPVAGFSPLQVVFQAETNLPATAQQVSYDFNGDDIPDLVTNTLDSLAYTYVTNGEYFPVVTIQTSVGRFSSIGGWNSVALNPSYPPVQINVQPPFTQSVFASITNPVDLKWDGTNLYVLSGSTATITEFATNGSAIRSLSGIGSAPSGIDVDAAGNVYVAVTASNQVWKFNPNTNSFQAATNFGNRGCIGLTNGASGTNNGQFSAPFGVAVSLDGGTISVSDSGNNRIQQFSMNGAFLAAFGTNGSGLGQFNMPKGLSYDSAETLYIVDSGNNRIDLVQDGIVIGASGTNGTDLGQFSGPANMCIGERGVYVADPGNNRIQVFDPPAHGLFAISPASIGYSISTNLDQPAAVAAVDNLTNETFYVADTANNRVLLYALPADDPVLVWTNMTACIAAGDISGAISYFSSASVAKYRKAFDSAGTITTFSAISEIGPLTPAFISNENAEYYFEQVIGGQTVTFPVEFVKENGAWKILAF